MLGRLCITSAEALSGMAGPQSFRSITNWATGARRGMIVAMKAPAQAARKAIPATGALLLRMADQDSSAVDQTPFTTDWKIAAGIAPSATAWIAPVSERAA